MTAERMDWVAGSCVAALLGVLVLLQGGYYEGPCGIACTVCAVLAVACLLREGLRVPGRAAIAPALFVLVVLAGLASAYVNGTSYAQLAALAPWLLFAAAAALFALLRPAERACAITAVAWLGAGCGVLGVLMFSGVLPFWGSVGDADGRLYFCFQYANTAGIWFLAASVLALGAPRAALRWAAFPSMAALALTLSGGAGLVAVLAYLVLAVVWSVRGQWQRVLALLVQGLLALPVCAVGFGVRARLVLLALLVGIGVCALLWWQEQEGGLDGVFSLLEGGGAGEGGARSHLRTLALVACVLVAVMALAALAVLAFPERLAEAVHTFLKRIVQMQDALALLGYSPLLGIGPDRWQFEYRFVQSASYRVARVHNGYLQLALDAGLVGLFALLAGLALLLVQGVRHVRAARGNEALREGRFATLVAAGALLLHAVVDFDFSFGAILVLLALLLSVPFGGMPEDADVEGAGAGDGGVIGGEAAVAASGAGCVVCAGPAGSAQREGEADDALAAGDGAGSATGAAETEAEAGADDGAEGTAPAVGGTAAGWLPAGPTRAGAVALLVACVLTLALIALSFWANLTRSSIVQDAQEGNVAVAAETAQQSAFALLDQALVSNILVAYANVGAWQEAIDFVELCGGVRGGEQAVVLATCHYALGDAQAAEELLIAELEAEPRNRMLFKQVKALFAQHGLSAANAAAYHAAVAAANELLWEGNNPLVASTKDMPEYKGT